MKFNFLSQLTNRITHAKFRGSRTTHSAFLTLCMPSTPDGQTALMEWKLLGVVSYSGAAFRINGANVWNQTWKRVPGAWVGIQDPFYGQPYRFPVYEFTHRGEIVRFAAGEFSLCIWGFYEPV